MYAKLTYIILLFAACLASSCTSDIPDNGEIRKGDEMSFAVADISRASVTTSFSEFAVYGDMKSPEDNNAAQLIIFNKTRVEYKDKDNSWGYDGTQYWIPKYEHSFVAINPLSVLEPANNPKYADSRLSFTYTIPTTDGNLLKNSDVSDILVATHRRLYDKDDFINDKDKNTTQLRFRHIMSLINIAPRLDDRDMNDGSILQFHKMELFGFTTCATFNIMPASRQSNLQTDDMIIDVTAQEGDAYLAIDFPKPVELKNHGQNEKFFADDDAVIMLPQAFGLNSEAKIVLTYTIDNDGNMKTLTIPLNNLRWESGTSYTYKITVDRMGLKLATTILSDWEVVNTDIVASIK